MNSLALNRGDHATPSTVLAIEPDANQALILERVLSGRIGGKLLVVESTEAALKALVDTIPDLVLVSPLLSPRTEDQFLAHLRALGVDASHLQILSIPRFGDGDSSGGKKGPFRLQSLKKLGGGAAPSCDPVAFANEVAAYLAQASDARHDSLAAFASVETPSLEPSDDALDGVRFEHFERLLEHLRDDSGVPSPETEKAEEDHHPLRSLWKPLSLRLFPDKTLCLCKPLTNYPEAPHAIPTHCASRGF